MRPILILALLTSLLACEKNREPSFNGIVAGEYDSASMEHYIFNPEQVIINNEIGCHRYLGIDSVNLDQHADWDLKFRYYLYNDIVGEC